MFLIFLALWIIFNGNLTLDIFLFGLVISALMFAFICKFMGYSFAKDLALAGISLLLLKYLFILIIEIIKANFASMKLLFSEKYEIEPVLVRFQSGLKTKAAKALLADSITLTPGTITVLLEGDDFVVHCLDKTLSQGLSDGIFVDQLKKIERMAGKWSH